MHFTKHSEFESKAHLQFKNTCIYNYYRKAARLYINETFMNPRINALPDNKASPLTCERAYTADYYQPNHIRAIPKLSNMALSPWF